jgi:hypothetical protein
MRPCCIRAVQPEPDWLEFASAAGASRIDRTALLREVPEFAGMADRGRAPVRAVFAAPQSATGRVFVGIDEGGGVRLIGCPDHDSEGGLAAMVSDLLATSGRLWNQQPAVLAQSYEAENQSPLTEAMRRRAGDSWQVERFMLDLAHSLREGKFPVVVLVDRRDAAVDEMMTYLTGMNLSARLIGYEYSKQGGIEVIRPVAFGDEPAPPAPVVPVRPAVEAQPPVSRTAPSSVRPAPVTVPREYAPFAAPAASPRQQEILKRLVYVEDLGLVRHGLEFFAPGVEGRSGAEGTIVVAIDKARWPFPTPEEVLVVVRTVREHLAGFIGMKQQEVEDFLSSLPREQRKERKGAVLLRASNVFEANQLVNELKALKEVAQTFRGG